MKKYISFALMAVALSFGFVSCDVETDEEPGGTNVEKMAGRWEVQVDAYDTDGNLLYEDPYGLGTIEIMTYNTADNSVNQMWLDDRDNFWAFQYKVDINYEARTFSSPATYYSADQQEIADLIAAGETPTDSKGNPLTPGKATVTNGKILEGAAKNLHGMPNDSIVFDITFDDDSYGFVYRISGQRYTGFYE